MSVDPGSDSDPLTPAQALEVERACDAHEAAWRSGERPRIEAHLNSAPAPLRVPLMRRMLARELALRFRRGERPTSRVYRERFPDHVALVDTVWDEAWSREAQAAGDRSATRVWEREETVDREPSEDEGPVDSKCPTRAMPAGSPPDEAPPAPGRLGDYELLGVIAEGGMGIVYRARHVTLDRPVALKMVRSGSLASRDELERFRREAMAVAGLDHPNILPIYEVGVLAGRPYFSMKLIEGGTLARRVPALLDDPISAATLLIGVARAVHHAHGRGFLHRDLKPSNILIDREGRPLVTDFGLAKRVGEDQGLTQSGALLGTPSYMAPEQASGRGSEVTAASDIYSLGSILYELLTGRPPFRAGTIMETVIQILELDPRPPRQLRKGADPDLELICLKCLEKDPKLRYPSALALAEDLERFVRGDDVEAQHPGPWRRFRRWTRREPRLALGLFDLVLVEALTLVHALGGSPMISGKLGVITLVLAGWAAMKIALQKLANLESWSPLVPPAWVVADVLWFTTLLGVVGPSAGWLATGYPLLIALAGLWSRVGVVWLAAGASVVSYGALLVKYYPEEISGGPGFFPSLAFAAMILTGNAVAFLVQRIRHVGSYFERQARIDAR